jgi:hypothetical protein
VTTEACLNSLDPDVHRDVRRYWRRRRTVLVVKPLVWLLTSAALATAGSASIADDVSAFKAIFPNRPKGKATPCAYLPALSSRQPRPRSSTWSDLADRLLGPGVTEHGTITVTDEAYLWRPGPRERSLGVTEFLVRLDTVESITCRRLRWGASCVRIDLADGEFVTFRVSPGAVDETFGRVVAA